MAGGPLNKTQGLSSHCIEKVSVPWTMIDHFSQQHMFVHNFLSPWSSRFATPDNSANCGLQVQSLLPHKPMCLTLFNNSTLCLLQSSCPPVFPLTVFRCFFKWSILAFLGCSINQTIFHLCAVQSTILNIWTWMEMKPVASTWMEDPVMWSPFAFHFVWSNSHQNDWQGCEKDQPCTRTVPFLVLLASIAANVCHCDDHICFGFMKKLMMRLPCPLAACTLTDSAAVLVQHQPADSCLAWRRSIHRTATTDATVDAISLACYKMWSQHQINGWELHSIL